MLSGCNTIRIPKTQCLLDHGCKHLYMIHELSCAAQLLLHTVVECNLFGIHKPFHGLLGDVRWHRMRAIELMILWRDARRPKLLDDTASTRHWQHCVLGAMADVHLGVTLLGMEVASAMSHCRQVSTWSMQVMALSDTPRSA